MKKTGIGILLVLLIFCGVLGVMPVYAAESPLNTVNSFYNVVVLAEFGGQAYSTEDLKAIDRIFNDEEENDVESVKEYFWRLSGKKLTVQSVFVRYQDSTMTKETFKNLGASDVMKEINYVTNVLSTVAKQGAFSDKAETVDVTKNVAFTKANFDKNEDGILDSVVFYPNLYYENTTSDNNSSIWPHAMVGLGSKFVDATDGKLDVARYIVNPYQYYEEVMVGFLPKINLTSPIGVICHEMLHNLGESQGIDDLYHYKDGGDAQFQAESPVGIWDVMAATDYHHPQVLNAYYLSLLQWADLNDASIGANKLQKTALGSAVKFGEKDGEFFVAEYRPSVTTNGVTTTEGIVVYRVNTNVTTGNRKQGVDKTVNNDQIYFFRKNECYYSKHTHTGRYATDVSTCNFFKSFSTGDKVELTYADGSACELTLEVGENAKDGYVVTVKEKTVDVTLRFVDENGTPITDKVSVFADGTLLAESTGGSCTLTVKYGQTLSFTAENYRFQNVTAEATNLSVTGAKLHNLTFVVRDADGKAVVGAQVTDGTSTTTTDSSGKATLRSTLQSTVSFQKEGFKNGEFVFSDLTTTSAEIRLQKAVDVTIQFHFLDNAVEVTILYEGKTYSCSAEGVLTMNNVGIGDKLALQGNNLLFFSDAAKTQPLTELIATEGGNFDVYVACPETQFALTLLNQEKQKISTDGVAVYVNGEPAEFALQNDKIVFSAKVGDTVRIVLQGYQDYEFRLTASTETALTVYLKPSYVLWYFIAGGVLIVVLIVAAAVMSRSKKR